MSTAEMWKTALAESEKYEMERSYGVTAEGNYDFKERQEAYYVELLCRMYELLRRREIDSEHSARYEKALLRIAKGLLVFSDSATEDAFGHINKENNTLFVATIYYVCGYEAIAALLLKRVGEVNYDSEAARQLYSLVSGKEYNWNERKGPNSRVLAAVQNGAAETIETYLQELEDRRKRFAYETEREFFDEQMLMFALRRFVENNLSVDLKNYDPETDWTPYIHYSASNGILSFLPSQRDAISKGLLDFEGAFSLKMPTSAGKSYITELIIYQELTKRPDSKILYLAPLRSLSRELGEKFAKIKRAFGYKIAVKYGGGSSTGDKLSKDIQILVSTPEFFISLEEGIEDLLEQYKLIICDEGQLLDDYSRGVNYEMLLTRLRKCQDKRFLFISAIIPNIEDINEWLGGTAQLIGDSKYRPSAIRLAKAVENGGSLDLHVYGADNITEDYVIDRYVDCASRKITLRNNRDMACVSALQAVNAGSVMLYVAFKRGARGCEVFSETLLQQIKDCGFTPVSHSNNPERLGQMAEYVAYQCGDDYLLTSCICNGLAYHHGDVPQDIRELIEEGIDDGALPLVVCTSTLAEGVNLPLKTIVLGNVNDPLFANQGWYLNKATLKNIIGRVGRAGRERYGLVIFPDNGGKAKPFSLIQDALNDIDIPKVQGTLFRLVNYLVGTQKVKNINDINELLGDNDLVAAIDLMITKSTDAENLEELQIENLISDSLAYKLGNNSQRRMLGTLFEARFAKLREQMDANEYALLKATGFSVIDLGKAHEIMSEADAVLLQSATIANWKEVLSFLMTKLYELPSVQEDLEDDSHKFVSDIISDKVLMIKICEFWMEGMTYRVIENALGVESLTVDRIIVSIIFMQNALVRKIRPLITFMKAKYEVDNGFVDAFQNMMSFGILMEEQMYLYQHGLRNRVSLQGIGQYLQTKGGFAGDYGYLRPYIRKQMDEIREFMFSQSYPFIAVEKIEHWLINKQD